MIGRTHIDMTSFVADIVEWPGDRKLLARNAAFPDEVRSVEVEGVGAHIFGHNLAALCHFVRPVGEYRFHGYCWKKDRSLPHIDLPNRVVNPKPGAWPFPIDYELERKEPLAVLIHTLDFPSTHGSIAADEVTYPTAAIMANWIECAFRDVRHVEEARRQEARDVLAGWACHLAAQDPVVPHHAAGLLLDGHSAFEGEVDEQWARLRQSGEAVTWAKKALDGTLPNCLRMLAEDNATFAAKSPRTLCWWNLWRPSMRKGARLCAIAGLQATVRCLRLLQSEANP